MIGTWCSEKSIQKCQKCHPKVSKVPSKSVKNGTQKCQNAIQKCQKCHPKVPSKSAKSAIQKMHAVSTCRLPSGSRQFRLSSFYVMEDYSTVRVQYNTIFYMILYYIIFLYFSLAALSRSQSSPRILL